MQSFTRQRTAHSGNRIALFDNLKGLLIILVVFGHMAHPVHNDNQVNSAAFDITYLFHMPLFVLISGLFAKSSYKGGRLNINRVLSFLALGTIFQMALITANGQALSPKSIVRFSSAPWYLMAMGWWTAMTPLLHKLGPQNGMIASIALCFAGGSLDLEDGFMAISRTLAFLPWSALGYYLRPNTAASVKTHRIAWIAVGISVAIACSRLADHHAFDWFFPMVYGDVPYKAPLAIGMTQKTIAMAIAGALSVAVIKLAPSNRSWLTTLGERTLQVYVLHRLVRALLTFRMPFYEAIVPKDPLVGSIALISLTVATIFICSASIFFKPFNGFLRIDWVALARTVKEQSSTTCNFEIESAMSAAQRDLRRLSSDFRYMKVTIRS